MAQNYSIVQITGAYSPSYEVLFSQVNHVGTARVNAGEAAAFMKRSGLSDLLLAKIWDVSDWEGRGSLDKHGWFVAMKLIALAQAGKDVSVGNLPLDVPPPRFRNAATPTGTSSAPTGGGAVQRRGSASNLGQPGGVQPAVAAAYYPGLNSEDRFKFERIFETQQPTPLPNQSNGKPVLTGDRVRLLLAATKLTTDTLASIWDLADLDRDGALDRDEFVIVMHLVHRTLDGVALPRSLPAHLVPTSKQPLVAAANQRRRGSSVSSDSRAGPVPPAPVSVSGWAVPESDRVKFEMLFRNIDTDLDGLVNGVECRDILLRSGLAQPALAQIWALCDTGNTGKLNAEQFILAMHLVHRKVIGHDVPSVLPPELVPPSMRAGGVLPTIASTTQAPVVPPGAVLIGSVPVADPKLLESSEIQDFKIQLDTLRLDKVAADKQRVQEESNVRLQQNELSMLQREFENVTATVRQLEVQKGEAQKRLDELAERTRRLRSTASETQERTEMERRECETLRNTVGAQTTTKREREEEISSLRTALSAVTQEEHSLNERLAVVQSDCDRLTRAIRETLTNSDRVRQTIGKFEEQKALITKLLGQIEAGEQPGAYTASQALEIVADPPELSAFSLSPSTSYVKPSGSTFDDTYSTGVSIGNANYDSSYSSSAFSKQADSYSAQAQRDPFSSETFATSGAQKTTDTFGAASTDDPFGAGSRSKSPAPPRPTKGPPGAAPGGARPPGTAPPRPSKPPSAGGTPSGAAPSAAWSDDPFASSAGSQMADTANVAAAVPAGGNTAQFGYNDFAAFDDRNSAWN